MPRIVKEHAVRHGEILDSAQRLIYSKGYESMTIQDILDDLEISKGAFYHYFDSKQALLEATVERLIETTVQIVAPIVDDPGLSALEKFERYFSTVTRWKNERKPFLLALLRAWYIDQNAVVREQARLLTFQRLAPLFDTLIHQGAAEGVFTTAYPEQAGRVVLSIMAGLEETTAELLLALDQNPDVLSQLIGVFAAHSDALERVLGAASGSLAISDAATLDEWVTAMRNEKEMETNDDG